MESLPKGLARTTLTTILLPMAVLVVAVVGAPLEDRSRSYVPHVAANDRQCLLRF